MLRTRLHRAITIVEVLVVIALISIVAAVVAPNMSGWACEESIKKNAMSVNYLLQRARNEAMNIDNNNVNRQILAILEGKTMNLYSIARGSCSKSIAIKVDYKTLDSGITANPSNFQTCFLPDGTAIGSTLTLHGQCGGNNLKYKTEVFGATGFIEGTFYNSGTGKWDNY